MKILSSRKIQFCLVLALIIHVFPFIGHAQVNANFHLYYLIGQSNMAGRGEVVNEFVNMGHPRVLMLNAANQWVPARNPVHFDKPEAGVGPALAFAIKMVEANPNITIGLIPCAAGGSSISAWQPGGTHSLNGVTVHPYDDGLVRANIARQTGVMKGVLFHQGEANSSSGYSTWSASVKTLIDNLRSAFSNANLPFLIGELGYFRPTSPNINNLIPQIVLDKVKTAKISAAGLTSNPDLIHFNNVSANTLGNRYADAMLAQYGITPQAEGTGVVLDDTYIRNGSYANDNYGNATLMDLKESSVAGYLRKAMVKVAVQTDDENSLASVELKLYCSTLTGGSSAVALYSQNPNWDENQADFNNFPAQATLIDTKTITTSGAYYTWDITSYIKTRISKGFKISSFILVSAANNVAISFNTKEASSNKPKVVVTPNTSLTATNVSNLKSDAEVIALTSMEKDEITVYPNPIGNTLNVYLKNNKEKITLKLFDAVGKQIKGFDGTITSQHLSKDVSFLNTGLYVLELNKNGKKVKTVKLIKQ